MISSPTEETVVRHAPGTFSRRNMVSTMERPPDAKLPARTRRSPEDVGGRAAENAVVNLCIRYDANTLAPIREAAKRKSSPA